jgi:anthranilate synthase component 1
MKTLPKIIIGQKPKYIKIADDVDFFSLFQKMEQEFDTCFLFESLGEEGKFDRYSLIGFSPKNIISARENVLRIDNDDYPVTNPYEALRGIMPEKTITREYAGGLVGYLSYEAVNYFEESIHVKIHDKFDQFIFGVYTDGIIYDKLTSELQYFYYDKNRLSIIEKILKTDKKPSTLKVDYLGNSVTKKEHAAITAKVKELIASGNIFQCEVGLKTEYEIKGNSLQVYKQLRKLNPSPFMFFLKFGEKKIIGASPELLFSLRDGEMTTRPLAGTIRRGKDEKEDQDLVKKLLNNPKEIAEHMMLVDLHRNDIGKIAQFGTLKIKDLLGIKKFSHVQHISSEISGLIKNNEDMFSGLAANFPTGTVTGAPKIEAMKIIDANEKSARGPYGGGVGHFGFNGDCTFAIALRSLFISGTYGYAQTSGGIVADSDAELEYQEIANKLAAVKKILDMDV